MTWERPSPSAACAQSRIAAGSVPISVVGKIAPIFTGDLLARTPVPAPMLGAGRRRGGALVARARVVDREPRRLRADEDVHLRAQAGIVVEAARRHDREVALGVDAR